MGTVRGLAIDNTDSGRMVVTEAEPTLVTAATVFEPRLVVSDDAIYIAHDDGMIRKWNLVGEQAEEFDPIPIAGPD